MLYTDIQGDRNLPPSIIEREVKKHILSLPHLWTPERDIAMDYAASMAIIGALRLGHLLDKCSAAWSGESLYGEGIEQAAKLIKANRNVLLFPEEFDFNEHKNMKFWAGRTTLESILESAKLAWERIMGILYCEKVPGSMFEESQPYARGTTEEMISHKYDFRAGIHFSSTGYCSLNVSDSASFGFSPRTHKITIVGGRPMIEILAVMGAVGLQKLGLWKDKAPKIPNIRNVPLRNWRDLEHYCASPKFLYVEPPIKIVGKRKYFPS